MQYNNKPLTPSNEPKYPIKFRGSSMIPRINMHAPLNMDLSLRQLDEILESLYRRPMFLEVMYVDSAGREWELKYNNYKKILANVKPVDAKEPTPPANPTSAPAPTKVVTPDPEPEKAVTEDLVNRNTTTPVPEDLVNRNPKPAEEVPLGVPVQTDEPGLIYSNDGTGPVSPTAVNWNMVGTSDTNDETADEEDYEDDEEGDDEEETTPETPVNPAQPGNNYGGKKHKRRHR